MSTYQFYEFQAVDRPLSEEEQDALRALSSRATITPTRFVNFYTFGSFKGDPERLVERSFDAHVYVASWGEHTLMFRLPRHLFDVERAAPYLVQEEWGSGVSLRTAGEHVLLTLRWREEDAWLEDESGEGWLASLLPLREQLLAGDLRALYLGWLAHAEDFKPEVEEEGERSQAAREVEPPVPPGLRPLSAPLRALADFLRISEALVAAAAEASPKDAGAPTESRPALLAWLRTLPAEEKEEALARLMEGQSPHLGAELLRRFRAAAEAEAPTERAPARRTVAQLLQSAQDWEARLEQQRRRAEARARQKALDALAAREEAVWEEVEAAFATQKWSQHDAAVKLLASLQELARSRGTEARFQERLGRLRELHAKRRAVIRRLDEAGLYGQ